MDTKAEETEGLTEAPLKDMVSEGRNDRSSNAIEAQPMEDVPDPDEDDLDDLDDMLDAFSPTRSDSKIQDPEDPKLVKPSNIQSPSNEPEENDIPEEDFAKQLQAGMADLLGELGNDPDMRAQFADIMKELGGVEGSEDNAPATPSKAAGEAAKASASAPATEESFQETIRKTMERMQASEGKATAAAADDDSEDILAELMKQMGSGALGGEGSEEDFSKMLLGMMEQLTNKEILYEPMKELNDKFPSWMDSNRATTTSEDLKRYEEQQTVVKEIVAKFEETTYSDDNAADREYIVDRMQKMQAAGSPPPDLVGDMAAAQEALAGPEDGCPQQ